MTSRDAYELTFSASCNACIFFCESSPPSPPAPPDPPAANILLVALSLLLRQSNPEFDFQPGHYRIFYTLSKSSMFAPWPESSPLLAPFPSVPAPVFPARRKNRDAKISRPCLPPPSRYPSSCLDRSPMPCRAASCIAKTRRTPTRTLAFARRSRVCRLRRMQRARPGQERHIFFSFHFFLC